MASGVSAYAHGHLLRRQAGRHGLRDDEHEREPRGGRLPESLVAAIVAATGNWNYALLLLRRDVRDGSGMLAHPEPEGHAVRRAGGTT